MVLDEIKSSGPVLGKGGGLDLFPPVSSAVLLCLLSYDSDGARQNSLASLLKSHHLHLLHLQR